MLQLIYISSVNPSHPADVEAILRTSRINNIRASVTGLLYADGKRFLQVLEGPEAAVEATFDRICGDPRHRAVVMLAQRAIETREFGNWSMAARRPGEAGEAFMGRISGLVEQASPNIRSTFESFAQLRRAA